MPRRNRAGKILCGRAMVGEGMMDARDSAWEERSHARVVTTAPRGTPGGNADRENAASSH